MADYIVTVSCKNRPGIVATIAGFPAKTGGDLGGVSSGPPAPIW